MPNEKQIELDEELRLARAEWHFSDIRHYLQDKIGTVPSNNEIMSASRQVDWDAVEDAMISAGWEAIARFI